VAKSDGQREQPRQRPSRRRKDAHEVCGNAEKSTRKRQRDAVKQKRAANMNEGENVSEWGSGFKGHARAGFRRIGNRSQFEKDIFHERAVLFTAISEAAMDMGTHISSSKLRASLGRESWKT